MSVKIGEKAPLFDLPDHNKQWVSLEQYQGQIVMVLFFPLAFTENSAEDLNKGLDLLNEFPNLNVQPVAISVDSVFALSKFAETNNIHFPLLSDFNKEVSRSYGVIYEEYLFKMRGVSKRAIFIIDREGFLQYAEILEKATNVPKFAEIRKMLNSLD